MSRTQDFEAIGDKYRATGKIHKAILVYKETGSSYKVASLLSMLAHNAKNLAHKILLLPWPLNVGIIMQYKLLVV